LIGLDHVADAVVDGVGGKVHGAACLTPISTATSSATVPTVAIPNRFSLFEDLMIFSIREPS
jgi:hypothetical protein